MNHTKCGPIIVWFRQDLRLSDNPSFGEAQKSNRPIIPVYILSDDEEIPWAFGSASRLWLNYSLHSLQVELEKLGLKLIIRKGSSSEVLANLTKETNADSVFYNRRYEPYARKQETLIETKLDHISFRSFNGCLLIEPSKVLNMNLEPYRIFTVFFNRIKNEIVAGESLVFKKPTTPSTWPESLTLDQLELVPQHNWANRIIQSWQPGEAQAKILLNAFLSGAAANYKEDRNLPYLTGTSRLSPYLHYGEISPRAIWHALEEKILHDSVHKQHYEVIQRQLAWREFAYYLLYHFPHTSTEPLNDKFKHFPWQSNETNLKAWQKGKTGYPIIDAAMQELWQTGWMHNRLRMVVASFLTKDLLIPWQEGARWFWDTLVDADLANNTLGWQWTAGCGADAAPYFRIFNPVLQGEKFDPHGRYVRKWLPQLAELPDKWIHKPFKAPHQVLSDARVKLGSNYPLPIVDHKSARRRALDSFSAIKKTSSKK